MKELKATAKNLTFRAADQSQIHDKKKSKHKSLDFYQFITTRYINFAIIASIVIPSASAL